MNMPTSASYSQMIDLTRHAFPQDALHQCEHQSERRQTELAAAAAPALSFSHKPELSDAARCAASSVCAVAASTPAAAAAAAADDAAASYACATNAAIAAATEQTHQWRQCRP